MQSNQDAWAQAFKLAKLATKHGFPSTDGQCQLLGVEGAPVGKDHALRTADGDSTSNTPQDTALGKRGTDAMQSCAKEAFGVISGAEGRKRRGESLSDAA